MTLEDGLMHTCLHDILKIAARDTLGAIAVGLCNNSTGHHPVWPQVLTGCEL